MKSYRYIIFNKPYGVLSQFTSDDHKTLSDYNLPKDIYAAGRLDKDSEGLLLLTNDGPFIKKFLDKHERAYWVQVEKIPGPTILNQLSEGVKIKSGMTQPCSVKLIDEPALDPRDPPVRFRKSIPTSWLEMVLTEGKNRQVRKMTAQVGYPTLRLFRCRLGGIRYLDYNLQPGQWIEVTKKTILGI